MSEPIDPRDESTERPVRGVVFDMDGLLMDSESLAVDSLLSAAAELGHPIERAFGERFIGLPADACRRMVRDELGEAFPLEWFFALHEDHLRAFVEEGRLALKEGVEPLLDLLDELGLPRAIATSSARDRADHHLELTGLAGRFDAVVTRQDVERGKPNPDPYLTACRAIDVEPVDALALEDSPTGFAAAHAAGLRCIVVPDLVAPSDHATENALQIVGSLDAVAVYVRRVNGHASA